MAAGHGDIRIVGAACVRGCGRPAREAGGYCTPCWMGLSASERAVAAWETDATTNDPLEALWRAPAARPRGRAA